MARKETRCFALFSGLCNAKLVPRFYTIALRRHIRCYGITDLVPAGSVASALPTEA